MATRLRTEYGQTKGGKDIEELENKSMKAGISQEHTGK